MKEIYKQPKVTVVKLSTRITILADSPYGDGIWGTGIDDTPGSQDAFG